MIVYFVLRQHPYRRMLTWPRCGTRSATFFDYLRDHQAVFNSSWSEAATYALKCLRGEL